MRLLQSSVFRAVVAIIVGALLVKYREDTVTWLTIAIGILFFLSGLTSVIIYYANKRNLGRDTSTVTDSVSQAMTPAFPIGGLGSMVLGVILAFMPITFIRGVVVILGCIVILATIGQFVSLAQARRYGSVPFIFWIFPSILLLIGVYCVAQPVDTASLNGLRSRGMYQCIQDLPAEEVLGKNGQPGTEGTTQRYPRCRRGEMREEEGSGFFLALLSLGVFLIFYTIAKEIKPYQK